MKWGSYKQVHLYESQQFALSLTVKNVYSIIVIHKS